MGPATLWLVCRLSKQTPEQVLRGIALRGIRQRGGLHTLVGKVILFKWAEGCGWVGVYEARVQDYGDGFLLIESANKPPTWWPASAFARIEESVDDGTVPPWRGV